MEIAHTISQAKLEDQSAIEELLEMCDLPYSDLTEKHLDHFFLIREKNRIEGMVGLEIYGENGLLRSLAVSKNARNNGYGKILVEKIEDYAQTIGIKELYLLTTTADSYFANRGYTAIERDEIPENVQESEEFSSLCPTSSIAMKKPLSER